MCCGVLAKYMYELKWLSKIESGMNVIISWAMGQLTYTYRCSVLHQYTYTIWSVFELSDKITNDGNHSVMLPICKLSSELTHYVALWFSSCPL